MNLKQPKESILDAGEKILREKGYGETSIRDVMMETDIHKGSFYNYFESKENFTREVIIFYGDRMGRFIDNYLNDTHYTPLNRLENLYRGLIGINRKENFRKGCLVNNLMTESGGWSETIAETTGEYFASWTDKISACVKEGQEKGELRRDLKATDLAHYLHSGFFGALSLMKAVRSEDPLTNWYNHAFNYIIAERD